MPRHRPLLAVRARLLPPAAKARRATAALAMLAVSLFAAGCSAADAVPADTARASASPGAAAGVTVDSIIPLHEALRRFRAGLAPTDTLAGGARSPEALATRYVDALARQDTAAIRAMVLDRAEFAYLYYPTSDQARPPRAQAPALAWFLMQQNGEKGITRALRRIGGQPLELAGLTCDPAPRQEEDNALWTGCVVTLRTADGTVTDPQRLFGSIIERDGRFKFVSYANQF